MDFYFFRPIYAVIVLNAALVRALEEEKAALLKHLREVSHPGTGPSIAARRTGKQSVACPAGWKTRQPPGKPPTTPADRVPVRGLAHDRQAD